jgi:hypothetical protein
MRPSPLEKLHGFYQPPPPPWTPQTIGWYILFGLFALLLTWAAWHILARWRHNRYRRDAVRELERLDASAIPALLKRTALAAWPRDQVASLSGESWIRFLETHGGEGSFSHGPGRLFLDLDYRAASLSFSDQLALRQIAGDWIRRHRVRA